jgi:hypothetical protein
MNFAKPNKRTGNPAGFFLEWIGQAGEGGGFKYWDREAKQQKTIKDLNNFGFILIDDDNMAITGWSPQYKVGIYSNEIPKLKCGELPLKVRAFTKNKAVIAEGLYKDIKDTCKASGGKYVDSIYIATNYFSGNDQLELHNIRAYGCVCRAWRNFGDDIKKGAVNGDFTKNWISISVKEVREGPASNFDAPEFSFVNEITENEEERAVELATDLSEYLEQYFGTSTEEEESPIDPAKEAEETETDTSDWRNYQIPGTDIPLLGGLKLERLEKMKEELESVQTFDVSYDNICAAIFHHKNLPKDKEKANPFFNKEKSKNPFLKEKEPDWEETLIEESGKKLKEFSVEQLTAMVAFCETSEGEAFKKYLTAIEGAIKGRDPF